MTPHGHDVLRHSPAYARPAVFAAGAEVAFAPPASARDVESAVIRFFAALDTGLVEAGCDLVGHIKGAIATPGGGDFTFHSTVLRARPRMTDGLAGSPIRVASLTVNVIVFGVDERILPGIVTSAWEQALEAEIVWQR